MENQGLKCKVVMLPTKNKSNLHLNLSNNELFITDYLTSSNEENESQHLYLISDMEIKDGDWKYCYHQFQGRIYKHNQEPEKVSGGRKIESTTDTSLTVISNGDYGKFKHTMPQTPQSFIEAYVKAEGKIDEVKIETYKIYDEVGVYVEDGIKIVDNTVTVLF